MRFTRIWLQLEIWPWFGMPNKLLAFVSSLHIPCFNSISDEIGILDCRRGWNDSLSVIWNSFFTPPPLVPLYYSVPGICLRKNEQKRFWNAILGGASRIMTFFVSAIFVVFWGYWIQKILLVSFFFFVPNYSISLKSREILVEFKDFTVICYGILGFSGLWTWQDLLKFKINIRSFWNKIT